MKKCLSFTICIVVCLILSTCSVSTQITTLPDGTQLNADEIARIEALKPEGEAFLSALQAKIKAPVDGESGSIEQI